MLKGKKRARALNELLLHSDVEMIVVVKGVASKASQRLFNEFFMDAVEKDDVLQQACSIDITYI